MARARKRPGQADPLEVLARAIRTELEHHVAPIEASASRSEGVDAVLEVLRAFSR